MANDRALGGGILLGSILGIIIYGVLLYFYPTLILEITAFLAVVVLLGILGWIGWTMATTPPPEPMPEMTGPATPPPAAGAASPPPADKPSS
ncbi:MAG: transcriptional regulator [Nitrososphaerota archaeon]|nr:transcriptional regulator [Nitrososphaerota archaeon]MDG6978489.1 transcriptional regulator [Nitrososphaerota archaeon]MDG7005813.1 transcriptional regulator [Nitrososphaerota archaeon]